MNYTDVKQLAWSNENHTRIKVLVTFDALGEVPFAAASDDPESHSREIFARCVAGDFGPIAPYEPPTGA